MRRSDLSHCNLFLLKYTAATPFFFELLSSCSRIKDLVSIFCGDVGLLFYRQNLGKTYFAIVGKGSSAP